MLLAHHVSLIVSPRSSVGFYVHYFQVLFPLLHVNGLPILSLHSSCLQLSATHSSFAFLVFSSSCQHYEIEFIATTTTTTKCSLILLFLTNFWFPSRFRILHISLRTCFKRCPFKILLFLCPSACS